MKLEDKPIHALQTMEQGDNHPNETMMDFLGEYQSGITLIEYYAGQQMKANRMAFPNMPSIELAEKSLHDAQALIRTLESGGRSDMEKILSEKAHI